MAATIVWAPCVRSELPHDTVLFIGVPGKVGSEELRIRSSTHMAEDPCPPLDR